MTKGDDAGERIAERTRSLRNRKEFLSIYCVRGTCEQTIRAECDTDAGLWNAFCKRTTEGLTVSFLNLSLCLLTSAQHGVWHPPAGHSMMFLV